MSDVNIVVLEEVWDDGLRDIIIEVLSIRWHNHCYNVWRKFGIGSGVLVMTNIPIVDGWFEPYNKLASWDVMSRKGILCLLLKGNMRVFVLHAQAEVGEKYNVIREDNHRQLMVLIDEWHSDANMLAIGDFNVNGDTYDRVFGPVIDSSVIDILERNNDKVDYILYKGKKMVITRSLVYDEGLSDHPVYIATFRLMSVQSRADK